MTWTRLVSERVVELIEAASKPPYRIVNPKWEISLIHLNCGISITPAAHLIGNCEWSVPGTRTQIMSTYTPRFSNWVKFDQRDELRNLICPGVYAIAISPRNIAGALSRTARLMCYRFTLVQLSGFEQSGSAHCFAPGISFPISLPAGHVLCEKAGRSGRICSYLFETLKSLTFSNAGLDFVYSPCVLVSRRLQLLHTATH